MATKKDVLTPAMQKAIDNFAIISQEHGKHLEKAGTGIIIGREQEEYIKAKQAFEKKIIKLQKDLRTAKAARR